MDRSKLPPPGAPMLAHALAYAAMGIPIFPCQVTLNGGQAEPSDAQIDALFADSWDADDLAEHERVRAAGGSASDQRRAVYRRRLAAAAVSGEQAQPDGEPQR